MRVVSEMGQMNFDGIRREPKRCFFAFVLSHPKKCS